MMIGTRLIPLLFPALALPGGGAEGAGFDLGAGLDPDDIPLTGLFGATPQDPSPEGAASEEDAPPAEQEQAEDAPIDPAAAPPCWWFDAAPLVEAEAGGPATFAPDEPPVEAEETVAKAQVAEAAPASPLPLATLPDGAPSTVPEPTAPEPTAPKPPSQDAPPSAAPEGVLPDGVPPQDSPLQDAPPQEPAPQAEQAAPAPPPDTPSPQEPFAAEPEWRADPPPPAADSVRPQEERPAADAPARRAGPPPQAPVEMPLPAREAPADPGDLGEIQVMFEREGETTRITLLADRPDTVDLMRRNADQLQQELRQEGFAHADLDFAERQDDDDRHPAGTAEPQAPTLVLPPPPKGEGLDLRL